MRKQRSVVSDQQSVAAVLEPGAVAALNEWGDSGVSQLPVPAPALGEVVRVDQVEEIELDLLIESPLNPRRTYDEKALNELAGSIRAIGITQPLIVRPRRAVTVTFEDGSCESAQGSRADCSHLVRHPLAIETEVDDCYELITGRRRAEAARLIGRATAPCIVRELSDEQAADIALIDNLQRADVEPLEEAAGFADLVARHGSVAAVATRVGKDVAHVTRRLRLLSCTFDVRDALQLRLIAVEHALLLSKLGAEEQREALKWCLDRNANVKTDVALVVKQCVKRVAESAERTRAGHGHQWEPESVARLKNHIECETGRKLATAPWDLADAELGRCFDAPACDVCPSNTKANLPLFGDLLIGEATCTDGGCFEAKRIRFVELRLSAVGAQSAAKEIVAAQGYGEEPETPAGKAMLARILAPIKLSWKKTTTPPRMDKESGKPTLTQTFKAGQWIEAKKGSCEHARLGVAADWEDEANRGYRGSSQDKHRKPGAELLICVEPKCKAHPKEWEKPKQQSGNESRQTPEDQLKREEKRLGALAETKLRVHLMAAAMQKIVKLHPESLRSLVSEALPNWGDISIQTALIPGFKKVAETAKIDGPEFARCVVLASLDLELIRVSENGALDARRKDFVAYLKTLGYDASKAWDKPAAGKQQTPDGGQKKPAKKAAKAAPKKAAKKSVKKAVRK